MTHINWEECGVPIHQRAAVGQCRLLLARKLPDVSSCFHFWRFLVRFLPISSDCLFQIYNYVYIYSNWCVFFFINYLWCLLCCCCWCWIWWVEGVAVGLRGKAGWKRFQCGFNAVFRIQSDLRVISEQFRSDSRIQCSLEAISGQLRCNFRSVFEFRAISEQFSNSEQFQSNFRAVFEFRAISEQLRCNFRSVFEFRAISEQFSNSKQFQSNFRATLEQF